MSGNSKIEACLDLLHVIAAHYPTSLDSFVPRGHIQTVINDLTSMVPGEGDEYLADRPAEGTSPVRSLQNENSQLREQLRVLIDEVAAHKEIETDSKSVFTSRIDHLQQELEILRQERQTLYEQAALAQEAMQARSQALMQNAEVKRINASIVEENGRLVKTNQALTQHMFQEADSDRQNSDLESEVREVLTSARVLTKQS